MNLDISQKSHPTVNPQEEHAVRTSPPAPPKVRPTTSSAWHRIWPWVRLLSGPLAAVLAILVLRSGAIPLYTEFTIGLGAVYALMVLSLSLLASWTGIWSIGHPALVAIGAYAMAYGSGHGWSLQLTIALTVTACALIGAFLGFVGSRFSVLYVALLTLAFTLVCLEIINVWQGVTNGDQGVPVNIVSTPLGDIFPSSSEAIYIVIGALGLCLAGAEAVRRSSIRLRLVAAKTHPVVARTIGIAPEAQSAIGFAASGGVAGLAGVMLGLVSGFVSPETFSLVLAVNLIAASVLGGTGSLIGAVLGGAFLASAPSVASSLSIDQPYLLGGLLILSLIFLPEGVVPAIVGRVDRWTGWTERMERSKETAYAAAKPAPTADGRR